MTDSGDGNAEMDLSWISSDKLADPGHRKSKKHKKNILDKKVEKKTKKGKKKDGLKKGTEKKKNQKKKKGGMDDHLLFLRSENLESHNKDGSKMDFGISQQGQISESKTRVSKKKTKKKVTFSLPKGLIRVKRPQFTSSSPKESLEVGNSEVVGQEDSPAGSEEFNSQDLFITQKTFRTSPDVESSEGPEELDELLRNDGPHKTDKDQVEEKCSRREDMVSPKVKPPLFHGIKTSVKKEDKKQVRRTKDQRRRKNSSTQTENFFTSELSSYLHFCQEQAARSGLQSCSAVDLRLSTRARNQNQSTSSLWPTSSNRKEWKNEQLELEQRRHPYLQTEIESKSVDTSTSSEDSSAKLDLTQVNLIQTRLNESFFFRIKAEPMTDRSQSPLMKLPPVPNLKKTKRR